MCMYTSETQFISTTNLTSHFHPPSSRYPPAYDDAGVSPSRLKEEKRLSGTSF